MKAFIEKVFKSKKLKQKELLDDIVSTEVKDQATEAVVKAIIKEVKKDLYSKPSHYFDDCNCFKCVRWRNQNAK